MQCIIGGLTTLTPPFPNLQLWPQWPLLNQSTGSISHYVGGTHNRKYLSLFMILLNFLELNWSHQLFGFSELLTVSHIMAGISEQTDTHKPQLCCYQCDIINQTIVLGISCTLPLPVTRQAKIKCFLGLVYTLNHCQVIVWDYKRAVYFSSSCLPISLLWFRFCDVQSLGVSAFTCTLNILYSVIKLDFNHISILDLSKVGLTDLVNVIISHYRSSTYTH